MSRKSKERYKDRVEAKNAPPAKPSPTAEALRRRRNKRFLFVGLLGLSFPILELIAYQFRAITITVVNRSDVMVTGIKVTYSGGDFQAPELKPGGTLTRVIRPDYTFKGEHFSNYTMAIRFVPEGGGYYNQMGWAGALDYSAEETYTIIQTPQDNRFQLQHSTRLGFPLSLVRGLMERMGLG